MDDFKWEIADQSVVMKWIGVESFFWSTIVLIELIK